jgi:hypothetical protein
MKDKKKETTKSEGKKEKVTKKTLEPRKKIKKQPSFFR